MSRAHRPERPERLERLDAWTLAGLFALSLPFLVRFSGADALPLRLCLLKATTGIPCPTCGATRTMGRLGDLDLAGALGLNPGVTLAWALVVAWALGRLTGVIRREPASLLRRRPPSLVLFLVVTGVLVNWAYVWLVRL